MNLTPSSPLAKARVSHPTAKAESAIGYVVEMLAAEKHHTLQRRYQADAAFRMELRALELGVTRHGELSRYPDDGIAPTGPATAAVEMDALGGDAA